MLFCTNQLVNICIFIQHYIIIVKNLFSVCVCVCVREREKRERERESGMNKNRNKIAWVKQLLKWPMDKASDLESGQDKS